MTRGDVLNKPFLSDRQINGVADNVALAAGILVYQDGANGLKVVPTSSQPEASRIRFLEKAADNTGSGHAALAVKAETYKSGAQVVGKADGALVVGLAVKASTNNAGEFEALVIPPDPTGGQDPTEAEHISLLEYHRRRVGIYRGHLGEINQSGSEPTDAVDNDVDIVVEMD